MSLFLCVLLGLACLGLSLRVYAGERALRTAARQLRENERVGSAARLLLGAPNAAAEELVAAVNELLELRQADAAAYRERELDLRRQISNVSHDLRTPLTSILGYLQLLEDPELPSGDRAAYLKVVEGRAKALQSLITGFYDLSRLEGGEFPLARGPVDLAAVLSGILASFYDAFTEAGFDVNVDLPDRLPPVSGDPNAVLRIFTNLIRNTLDHGAGRVDIRVFQEGGEVVSVFTNDAPDMAPGDLEHVFDRFFTSDKVRTGRNTGLGLAIVKALAEQMGHVPSAELEDGRFTVRIRWKC